MREGDVSRRRRLIGPVARLRWYAHYRALRFARRFGFTGNVAAPPERERRDVCSAHGGIVRALKRFPSERRLSR
jgi:hypothetical protein